MHVCLLHSRHVQYLLNQFRLNSRSRVVIRMALGKLCSTENCWIWFLRLLYVFSSCWLYISWKPKSMYRCCTFSTHSGSILLLLCKNKLFSIEMVWWRYVRMSLLLWNKKRNMVEITWFTVTLSHDCFLLICAGFHDFNCQPCAFAFLDVSAGFVEIVFQILEAIEKIILQLIKVAHLEAYHFQISEYFAIFETEIKPNANGTKICQFISQWHWHFNFKRWQLTLTRLKSLVKRSVHRMRSGSFCNVKWWYVCPWWNVWRHCGPFQSPLTGRWMWWKRSHETYRKGSGSMANGQTIASTAHKFHFQS